MFWSIDKPGKKKIEEKFKGKEFLPPKNPEKGLKWDNNNYVHFKHKPGTIGGSKAADVATYDKLAGHYKFEHNHPEQSEERQQIHDYTGSGSKSINPHLIKKHVRQYGDEKALRVASQRLGNVDMPHYWSDNERQQHENTVTHKDTIMSRALSRHTTPHDLHVYTGSIASPEHVKKEGGVKKIHLPAYTSTSLNPKTTEDFATHDPTSIHAYNKMTKKIVPDYQHHRKIVDDYYNMSYGEVKTKEHTDQFYKSSTAMAGSSHYAHVMHIHVPEGSHGAYVGHISSHPNEREFILHKNALVHVHPTPVIDHDNQHVVWHGKLVHDGVEHTKFAK